MGNSNSTATEELNRKITNTNKKIVATYRGYEKALEEMQATIERLQERIDQRKESQDLLSALLCKTVPAIELAQRRISRLERSRIGDLDEYEEKYGLDGDSGPEGAETAGCEKESLFSGMQAGSGSPSYGHLSDLDLGSISWGSEDAQDLGLGLALAPPREEGFREGRWGGFIVGLLRDVQVWMVGEARIILTYSIIAWLYNRYS
ncbi:hypothetical protein HOY82DRAFT_596714 [Tuber indicum]|nr:hypothetical protein HOY82DRAFT_596714 [Tuber indicum]